MNIATLWAAAARLAAAGTAQRLPRTMSACAAFAAFAACAALSSPAWSQVVISQVYGGGGNSGATLRHDFIELKNRSTTAQSVGGWSVQYASATGGSWQVTSLPAGTTIPAGAYLLVRQAAGTGGTVDVQGDVNGTIAMAGASGKVALANTAAPLAGTVPTGATLVDAVSYGTANGIEGSPTPALSNTTAALRNSGGCADTGNNAVDFTVEAASPRNSSATPVVCENGGGGGGGVVTPVAATIPTIQGSGATSALVGQTVITSGVVTRVTGNGFFMQDLTGDGDAATSDGLFVFTGNAVFPAVATGNLVQVQGSVSEFAAGSGSAASPLTQIAGPASVTLVGTGYTLAPVPVVLPVASGESLERFEGMLVRIETPLTVQANELQARFGLLLLGAGGRHEVPTNRHRPNSAQALALADLQARSRILLDDGSSAQNVNPTPYFGSNGQPRVGDTVQGLVGTLDFGPSGSSSASLGLYRLQPVAAPVFTATNPRPGALAGVDNDKLKVAGMNVLNYFTTFTNGQTVDGQTGQGCTVGTSTSAGNCRGANNLAEFQRQRDKIVRALAGLDADVIGLMEIQNNGNVAAQDLVNWLNAQVRSGPWAVAPLPAAGTGSDAIRLAMIYKPAKVTPVGGAFSDTDPVNSRPTLAQTFQTAGGQRFTYFVNHLKSKGGCPSGTGPDADQGDGQGCWNATRLAQAQRLRSFVAQVQSSSGVDDVLLMGDFNAYGQEDPIVELTSNGFVDQALRSNASATTYVFDGYSGRLDHAIASNSLSPKVLRATAWPINADEQVAFDYNLEFKQPACAGCAPDPTNRLDPYRSSDHDPILVVIDFGAARAKAPPKAALSPGRGTDARRALR